MIGIKLLWGRGVEVHLYMAVAGCLAGLLSFTLPRIKSVQEDTAANEA